MRLLNLCAPQSKLSPEFVSILILLNVCTPAELRRIHDGQFSPFLTQDSPWTSSSAPSNEKGPHEDSSVSKDILNQTQQRTAWNPRRKGFNLKIQTSKSVPRNSRKVGTYLKPISKSVQ